VRKSVANAGSLANAGPGYLRGLSHGRAGLWHDVDHHH
jgi:hypothetical protein